MEIQNRKEKKKALPPTYFFRAIVLSAGLHFLLPGYQLLRFPWRLAGPAPLAAGLLLNLLADRTFKKKDASVKPFERSTILVTAGVFAISRHPMYLGMTLILLGIALLLGSLTPLFVPVGFPLLMDRLFVSPEEHILASAFGDRFCDYRRLVSRWTLSDRA